MTAMLLVGATCVPLSGAVAAQAFRVYLFDESSGGFESVDDPLAIWQWGTPEGSPVFDGAGNVWATDLDSHYLSNATVVLRSPTFSLDGYPGASMVLDHYYDIDPNGSCILSDGTDMGGVCGDGAFVRLVDGDGVAHMLAPMGGYNAQVVYDDRIVAAYSGQSGEWITSYFDLDAYPEGDLAIELVFVSNESRWADGWYVSAISFYDGDVIPPEVSIKSHPGDTSDVVGPYPVVATASDNRGVAGVTLHYRIDGGKLHAIDMVKNVLGFWEGDIPGQPIGTEVQYYLDAVDVSDNHATAPFGAPAGPWMHFRVRLPPPTGLDFVPSPPPALALTLGLQWRAPLDVGEQGYSQYGQRIVDYQILHTVLDAGGEVVSQEPAPDLDGQDADLVATVSAAGRPYTDQYQVCARYEVVDAEGEVSLVNGDYSDPVATTVYVPRIQSVVPSAEYQGESTRVQIVGAYTTFVEGDVTLDFGRGIQVTDLSVESVTRLLATIVLAGDAPVGPRSVVVTTGDETLVADSAFEVLDPATRPRIVGVDPDYVRVREEKTIKFTGADTDFTLESPSVDFWDDIQVLSLDVISRTEFVVDIEAAPNAAVGDRTIHVVSGGNLFQVPFRVVAEESITTSACSASGRGDARTIDFALMIAMLAGVTGYRRHGKATGRSRRGDHETFRATRRRSGRRRHHRGGRGSAGLGNTRHPGSGSRTPTHQDQRTDHRPGSP